MRTKLLIVLILVCCVTVQAQVPKRAQKYYDAAMHYKAGRKTEKAYSSMLRAIKEYPAYDLAYGTLGTWYYEAHLYGQAAALLTTASKVCTNGGKRFVLPLARSLLYCGRGPEAMQVLQANVPAGDKKEWQRLYDEARFAEKALRTPWKDTIVNLGVRINTKYAEMYPLVSADGKTLFYTRRTNGIDEDFYRSDPDSCGGWLSGKPLGYPLNTLSQEAAQTVSADRHYLFFMRCDNRSPNGWDGGGCDLYMAYTADSVWSVPESFGATINTPGFEGMPCLSPDNRELFFVSDREGGYGGLDIWSSRFEHGLWQPPHNLGPTINTPGNEITPYLFADNQTLYFASDGRAGMGGSDLYMCRRTDDTNWTEPENLGYPINTTYDETSLSLTADGLKGYFSSNRDNTAGNFDLYEMNWPEPLRPAPVSFVKGYVYDSLTRERLNYTSIFVSDAETNKELYHYTSNRGDGSFVLTLPANRQYAMYVDRISYQNVNDTIIFDKLYLGEPLVHNYSLLPSDYEKPKSDSLVLTVHFRKNSTALSDTDKAVIHTVLEPWLQRKDITVLVNGYTDNSGTPMLNEQLSYLRADLVSKEVGKNGFAPDIIQGKGWGETGPVTDNDTEEHRDMNRRVEIVIRH